MGWEGQGGALEDGGHSREIRVETYSGYRANERPRALTIEGRRLPVRRILERRRTPDSEEFLVEAGDARRFWIAWDRLLDRWKLR